MVANCEVGGIYAPNDQVNKLNALDAMIYRVDEMLYGNNATVSPTKRLVLLKFSKRLVAQWEKLWSQV